MTHQRSLQDAGAAVGGGKGAEVNRVAGEVDPTT
jgi:hypothetical protein